MVKLQLKPIQHDDIPLLSRWLNKEYIIKWYHDPKEWISEVEKRFDEFSFVKHFLVTLQNKPIGFCQYYNCNYSGENWGKYTIQSGTYSIDYLIGEEDFLGKNYGKEIIGILINLIFSFDDSTDIIVAPEPTNIPSCKSLVANGFVFDETNKLYYLFK